MKILYFEFVPKTCLLERLWFVFQPLMECYVTLREKGTAINIRLTETWWRHYQVDNFRPDTTPAINYALSLKLKAEFSREVFSKVSPLFVQKKYDTLES